MPHNKVDLGNEKSSQQVAKVVSTISTPIKAYFAYAKCQNPGYGTVLMNNRPTR